MDSLETLLLNGKVRRRTLPSVRPPFPADKPLRKRLLLPQGELAQVHDGSVPIRYIAFLELVAGTVRGNHYHMKKEEYVYVIAGEILLLTEDVETRERASVVLQAGDLAFIQTGVAHAMKIKAAGQGIEFSEAAFDPDDIVKANLV